MRLREHSVTSSKRPAEHGFTSLTCSAEHGFTLIELLVSLLIFAMMATAGVALLSGTVSAQGAVRARLDDMAAVRRAAAIMTADLAQASARISRTETGTLAPAFFAGPREEDRPLLQFVRGGWESPQPGPRSSLQKLEYRLNGDRLQRVAYPQVDGASPGEPMTLIEGVAAISFRFRALNGTWRDRWTPEKPTLTPRLVEMVLTRHGQAPLRLLFPVAPGPDDKPIGITVDG